MLFVALLHCCTSALYCILYSNARVRYKISAGILFICKQGLQLIFKPNSINCFVLARNTASMLQIRNATYQNVPKSLNYTLQYFVSSSSMLKLQQFPTFLRTSRQITFLPMLRPSNGPKAIEIRIFSSAGLALPCTECTQGSPGPSVDRFKPKLRSMVCQGVPVHILRKAKRGWLTKTFEFRSLWDRLMAGAW